ncbi:ATP-dependent DNA helicase homolog RECG, chloroplastic-like isoform X2 [Alnus glutinosa]|uniref:ATP-dependent DNA helicase homolog RECG, chloroplastic-like isoform X2 n=1 Tax=Alnus glutinosa TaxID=3517 RepID=UPI002D7768F1|nr:ATP-dependent DNA helicase homolog RECG, chloroplastic-like isoform X2 [Alnus glutinosa]
MRFNKSLLSKVSKFCSRPKHELAGKLLEEVPRISGRSKILNKGDVCGSSGNRKIHDYGSRTVITPGSKGKGKDMLGPDVTYRTVPLKVHPETIFAPVKSTNGVVSVLIDYDDLHDLVDNESAKKRSCMNLKGAKDEFDDSLAYKRFPSIILGSSPQVELYDETACCSELSRVLATQNCEGFLPNSIGAKLVQEGSRETGPSVSPVLLSVTPSPLKEDSYETLSFQPVALETIEKSNSSVTVKESSIKVGPESLLNSAPIELFLDRSINCIPGLSKRHCRQLENCGFHTLRELLYHFPRTYADLQNAQTAIDDRQYLICIGKILSSRGIRNSCSFSFLEVVVGCEIADNQSTSEHTVDDIDSKGKKTIYLHLKKFFHGTRFTFQPFLKSLEEKHKEGEIVCVSGKVGTMHTKDHFEMREYNIDALEDQKDLSFCAKEKPYLIYPSKGGLNPNFLRDIIARALRSLPVNIDPIPKDVTQGFGLLSLRNSYFLRSCKKRRLQFQELCLQNSPQKIAVAEPPLCTCGAGRMVLFMARTEKNYGRWFYRCPLWEDHRLSFLWVDEFYPEEVLTPVVEAVRQPHRRDTAARAKWWVLARYCRYTAAVGLFSFSVIVLFVAIIAK